jgi:hypothetical protein
MGMRHALFEQYFSEDHGEPEAKEKHAHYSKRHLQIAAKTALCFWRDSYTFSFHVFLPANSPNSKS